HRLDDEVVAGTGRERTRLAEARDRAVHDVGPHGAQALVVEAIAGELADLVVLDDDVAVADEVAHRLLSGGAGDVEHDRALVAVGRQVVGGVRGLAPLAVREERRAPAAGIVAAARLLDLDDIGAEVAEALAAPGPGEDPGQVEDANTVETALAHVCGNSLLHQLPRGG